MAALPNLINGTGDLDSGAASQEIPSLVKLPARSTTTSNQASQNPADPHSKRKRRSSHEPAKESWFLSKQQNTEQGAVVGATTNADIMKSVMKNMLAVLEQ